MQIRMANSKKNRNNEITSFIINDLFKNKDVYKSYDTLTSIY